MTTASTDHICFDVHADGLLKNRKLIDHLDGLVAKNKNAFKDIMMNVYVRDDVFEIGFEVSAGQWYQMVYHEIKMNIKTFRYSRRYVSKNELRKLICRDENTINDTAR